LSVRFCDFCAFPTNALVFSIFMPWQLHIFFRPYCEIFKDWSQLFFDSWRNKLKNVVHTV
jgi:hypothetical protein